MKDIEGYSTAEIAKILETDESNVRTILSRGRKALKAITEKEIEYCLKHDQKSEGPGTDLRSLYENMQINWP